MKLEELKKVHMVGVLGSGLATLKHALESRGAEVSGSDLALGGHKAENVPEGIDLLIYTVAATKDNPEISKAEELGVPVLSYPEFLGELSKQMYTIAIAGTHGKTTTTNMIGKLLTDLGRDPLVIAGAPLQGGTYMHGNGEVLVVEACEYKRSFIYIKPDIAVITTIDADHLDYYKDEEGVRKAFKEFVQNIKPGGKLIQDYSNLEYREMLKLKIPGNHNIQNALNALGVAEVLELDIDKAISSLNSFSGAERRFELKGENRNGATVYDDYGHHPREIEATIQGIREKYPDKKIVVVFQPHMYSRTKAHFGEFVSSLSLADEVILVPIYAARDEDDPEVSSEKLALAIGDKAKHMSMDEVGTYLGTYSSTYLILVMGAGDVYKLSNNIINN